ncbi:hypothetical protein GGR57DRAFT_244328 [Xylariaceae sp. FL1272]|nr:hypothetical protein GGR57DRAFT_244328 [Xylariaceae sp. FL1272]
MAVPDAKTRIMSHMNKEHGAELKQYLRAFNGLSSSAAADAELIDLSLDTLSIKSASGVHKVRISPPMKTLADARVRLVDMAQVAQQKLGLSDIRINEFEAPRGVGIVSFIGVSFYFASALALSFGLLRPGTTAWATLDNYFPYGAQGFAWLVKAIAIPVLIIHVTEAWWMARGRLATYGIEVGSTLWFLWVVQVFLEGFPAMARFDSLVAAEKKKKESVKH